VRKKTCRSCAQPVVVWADPAHVCMREFSAIVNCCVIGTCGVARLEVCLGA